MKVRALGTDDILRYMSPRIRVTPNSDSDVTGEFEKTPTIDFEQFLQQSAKRKFPPIISEKSQSPS